jgi:hypothetical protein
VSFEASARLYGKVRRVSNGAPRSTSRGALAAGKSAYIEFEAAVLEFSDAPSPVTLLRYLNASRVLDGLDPLSRRRAASVGGRAARVTQT